MNRLIILVLLLVIPSLAAVAQKNLGDTAKRNEKWDPNDPSCPCYKVQKQAEKEYQEFFKKEQPEKTGFNFRSDKKYTKTKRIKKRKNYSGKPVCPSI